MQWNDKRYNALSFYLKQAFGEKVYKVALNGGMTCPTRDGTIDTKGCIFCSGSGSGEYAEPVCENVTLQIDRAIKSLRQTKPAASKYIAYFQAYTNTYAPITYLRELFFDAISHPQVVCLSIATRPDCLSEEVLCLLAELRSIKPVWVELGLQTIHADTARFIRRGYPLSTFQNAVSNLHHHSIEVIVHIILGLPKENEQQMIETIDYISALPIQGVKLQMLHILKATDLEDCLGQFHIMTLSEYVSVVIQCIEHLREDIVIHRLTGDAPGSLLIEPLWSLNKRKVLNTIEQELKRLNTCQGAALKHSDT